MDHTGHILTVVPGFCDGHLMERNNIVMIVLEMGISSVII